MKTNKFRDSRALNFYLGHCILLLKQQKTFEVHRQVIELERKEFTLYLLVRKRFSSLKILVSTGGFPLNK